MSLFNGNARSRPQDVLSSSDSTSKTLSVVAVENSLVERVYENLACVYDLTYGPILHRGRLQAIERIGIESGDRVLEVGVGTGINTTLYPTDCSVIGIDLSSSMLERAYTRVSRHEIENVRLLKMDAADLRFPDESFDIVYASYLMNVVPDPIAVEREMRRVCKVGGRIIFLNHFMSQNPVLSKFERLISPLTVHIGFRSDLDLEAFLAQADLQPISIEKLSLLKLWSLVTCVKE